MGTRSVDRIGEEWSDAHGTPLPPKGRECGGSQLRCCMGTPDHSDGLTLFGWPEFLDRERKDREMSLAKRAKGVLKRGAKKLVRRDKESKERVSEKDFDIYIDEIHALIERNYVSGALLRLWGSPALSEAFDAAEANLWRLRGINPTRGELLDALMEYKNIIKYGIERQKKAKPDPMPEWDGEGVQIGFSKGKGKGKEGWWADGS